MAQPYAQNPYQQSYGRQAHQQPYVQPQFGQPMPPPAAPQRRASGIGMAGEGRRHLAVLCDVLVTVVFWYVAGDELQERYEWNGESGQLTLMMFCTLLAVSFANHVVLTLLTRASVGKLITGIRVVRAADGGRPGPFRLIWRWLAGLCWLPLQPYYWLRAQIRAYTGHEAPGTVRNSDGGEIYAPDLCGLRPVRRKDL